MKKLILLLLILSSCITPNRQKEKGIIYKSPSCLESIEDYKTESLLIDFLEKKSDKNPTILGEDYFLIACDDIDNFAALTYNGKKIILYNQLFFIMISKIINTGKNVYEDRWEHPAIKFILFHEMGHIENGHTIILDGRLINPFLNLKDRVNAEIEADEFASLNMYLKGFTDMDVTYFFSLINSYFVMSEEKGEQIYNTHPDYIGRTSIFKETYSKYKLLMK